MNKAILKLAIVAVLMMFLLAGCTSNIDTLMDFNDDFSGTRTMSCKFSRQKIRTEINGGEVALDSFIKINCPEQLSYEKIEDSYNIIYKFILSFNSRDDYIEKVENILGNKPLIVFATPQSPFSKGLILQENFSSKDLLGWFEGIGSEKEILNSKADFFTANGTVVKYNGNSVATQDFIAIRDIKYLRIDKISIFTKMKADGVFERSVKFEVPNESFNNNPNLITEYMNQRVPEGGIFKVNDIENSKVFIIEFEARNSEELSNKMIKLLDNNSNKAEIKNEKNEFFGDKNIFSECVNLCSFISDYSGKVYLEYEFISESELEISKAEVFSGGVWSESVGYKKPKSFIYFGDESVFEVNIVNKDEYKISNIAVNMNQLGNDSFKREIIFEFPENREEKQTKGLREYFLSLNPKFAFFEVFDRSLKVSIKGSAEEINLDLNTLFGENNSIQLKTNYGFKLFETTNLEDKMDFKNIINLIGSYNGQVGYSYSSDKKVESISQREEGNADMDVSAVYDENGTLLLNPSNVTFVDANCSKLNVPFAIMCFIGILFLALIVLIILYKMVSIAKQNVIAMGFNGKKETLELLDEYCPTCGARVYKGTTYCRICGSIVGTIIEFEKNKK